MAVAAALAFALGASAGSGGDGGSGGGGQTPERGTAGAGVPAGLSLERAVGELMIVRFEGARVPAYVRGLLRDGRASGAILFADNLGPAGARGTTRVLQRAARGGAIVATDDEGGEVTTVPTTPALPAASQIAGDVAGLTRNAGADLRRAGVNVNLAPVADIALPGSVMSGRAFSGSAEAVAAAVVAATRGYGAGRVGATLKHFPGFGRATANTDDAAVTIDASAAELETDLVPFHAAIEAGAPLIMASHALYPALDRRRIASQSAPILQGLLRRRLGFDGAVITDSIEAEAVTSRSSVEVAAQRSVEAGADLILMTGRGSWIRIYPAMLARARRDGVFRAKVEAAAARVIRFKRRLGLAT
ncbi:MAG: beta-N-acetylhexosaminidase [Solirubrobacterales bacterium]|nr:beta-N-acetylhexosaminidase [Solirubrobacterales bacterium]